MESYELAILLARALDRKKGGDLKVLKTEGLTTLADYFVICTATSNTEARKFYDLERLWGDAEEMDISKELLEG